MNWKLVTACLKDTVEQEHSDDHLSLARGCGKANAQLLIPKVVGVLAPKNCLSLPPIPHPPPNSPR